MAKSFPDQTFASTVAAKKRENPLRRGELRCPDDVELEYVRSAGVRVQPLDIQLVPLRRVIGRWLDFDAKPGMLRHEPRDLAAHHRALGSERAPGERDDSAVRRPTVAPRKGSGAQREIEEQRDEAWPRRGERARSWPGPARHHGAGRTRRER
jgi:hypothetical protein